MHHHLHRAISVVSGAIVAAALGCAHTIDVMPSSTANQDTSSQTIADTERVPFVIETFRQSQNGSPQNPSLELERRFLNSVQETSLFSAVVPLGESRDGVGGKLVTARLAFDETIDSYPGEAALKGILIGASMFLLSPFIDLNYDYTAQAYLELERWDGHVTHYEARSFGTAHYNLFGASPTVINELKGQVIETCLNSLMDRLVQDTAMYMASKTPLPASTIRTVTVKTNRPAGAAAHPIVPVSANPAP